MLGLIVLSLAAAAWAEFDSRGWRYVRQISIPGDLPDGPVVVPLMSHIIEKCRPDLGDLRVVSTEGIAVSAAVGGTDPPRKNNLLPAKIYRIAKRPGAWTDIWIDKGTKTLGSGVLIGTGSRDFVRKVEVRGSDNGKDLYVIRMDGLIIDRKEPIPLRSLDIEHPLNNFQYVVLRIHDDGEPPLKIESVSCYPPMPEHGLSHPLSVRMIENRVDAHRSATVIVAELRNNDHPLSDVAINTRTKDFVKNVVVHCSSSASGPWNRVFEGAFFRATSGDVGKENLKVAFKPQACRFLMLELAGPSGPPVQVDGIEATSTIPFIAFDHSRGRSYRLYYGNESAALLLSPPTPSILYSSYSFRLFRDPSRPGGGKRACAQGRISHRNVGDQIRRPGVVGYRPGASSPRLGDHSRNHGEITKDEEEPQTRRPQTTRHELGRPTLTTATAGIPKLSQERLLNLVPRLQPGNEQENGIRFCRGGPRGCPLKAGQAQGLPLQILSTTLDKGAHPRHESKVVVSVLRRGGPMRPPEIRADAWVCPYKTGAV